MDGAWTSELLLVAFCYSKSYAVSFRYRSGSWSRSSRGHLLKSRDQSSCFRNRSANLSTLRRSFVNPSNVPSFSFGIKAIIMQYADAFSLTPLRLLSVKKFTKISCFHNLTSIRNWKIDFKLISMLEHMPHCA